MGKYYKEAPNQKERKRVADYAAKRLRQARYRYIDHQEKEMLEEKVIDFYGYL